MAASSTSVGSSHGASPQGNPALDSLASQKYHPVQMIPAAAVERVGVLIGRVKLGIPMENPKFECPVTLEVMKNPFVTNCGHTFEKTMIKVGIPCHSCRTPVTAIVPNFHLTDLIDKWQEKSLVPTFARVVKQNDALASQLLAAAAAAAANDAPQDAIDLCKVAFRHTRKSEHYAALPSLYEQMNDHQRAALAYLHLAAYQLEEDNVLEAIQTLKCCKERVPDLPIESLLIGLGLLLDPSQQNINDAKHAVFSQSDEEKMAIYKQC